MDSNRENIWILGGASTLGAIVIIALFIIHGSGGATDPPPVAKPRPAANEAPANKQASDGVGQDSDVASDSKDVRQPPAQSGPTKVGDQPPNRLAKAESPIREDPKPQVPEHKPEPTPEKIPERTPDPVIVKPQVQAIVGVWEGVPGRIEFKADGTFADFEGTTGTYTWENNQIKIKVGNQSPPPLSCVVNGDSMQLTAADGQGALTFTRVAANAAAKAPDDGKDNTIKQRLLGKWKFENREWRFRSDGYVTGSYDGANLFLEPSSRGFDGKGYKLKYQMVKEGESVADIILTVIEMQTRREASMNATVKFSGQNTIVFTFKEKPSQLASLAMIQNVELSRVTEK